MKQIVSVVGTKPNVMKIEQGIIKLVTDRKDVIVNQAQHAQASGSDASHTIPEFWKGHTGASVVRLFKELL